MSIEARHAEQSALELRRQVCRLFGASTPNDVVLSPGILAGLRILFPVLRTTRLLISTEEYYTQEHFPDIDVHTCSVDRVARKIETLKPDAVLMSVVSWKGHFLQQATRFREIRKKIEHPPILIADYSHAGAVGFPAMKALGADLVCGDFSKWVTPFTLPGNVAFVWGARREWSAKLRYCFAHLYLATSRISRARYHEARWISSDEVRAVAEWLGSTSLRRSDLLAQFGRNKRLTMALSARLTGKKDQFGTCMLWLPSEAVRKTGYLRGQGLVWEVGRRSRILCRADLIEKAPR